jgi:hypothetical protein
VCCAAGLISGRHCLPERSLDRLRLDLRYRALKGDPSRPQHPLRQRAVWLVRFWRSSRHAPGHKAAGEPPRYWDRARPQPWPISSRSQSCGSVAALLWQTGGCGRAAVGVTAAADQLASNSVSLTALARSRSGSRSPCAAAFKMRSAKMDRLVTVCWLGGRLAQARSRVVRRSAMVSGSKYMTVRWFGVWQCRFHAVFG